MRRSEMLKNFGNGKAGLEIGVWKGKFSELLYHSKHPSHLTLVDPWEFIPSYEEALYGNCKMNQEEMDKVFNSVVEIFTKFPNVTIMRMDSDKAFELFQERDIKFDWIYIDGNHSYEFVKKDLENAFNVLNENGVIALDDYHSKGWWGDGVVKAVDECVAKDSNICIEVFDDNVLLYLDKE